MNPRRRRIYRISGSAYASVPHRALGGHGRGYFAAPIAGMLSDIVSWPWLTGRLWKRTIYSAGNTASTPFFFTKTTTNFADFVVLALRPTI